MKAPKKHGFYWFQSQPGESWNIVELIGGTQSHPEWKFYFTASPIAAYPGNVPKAKWVGPLKPPPLGRRAERNS